MTDEQIRSVAHRLMRRKDTSSIYQLLQGARVRVFDNLDISPLDGISAVFHGMPTILLNLTLQSVHKEFVLAHEFGHIVLHFVLPDVPRTRIAASFSPVSNLLSSELEYEADLFASYFVLPDREALDRLWNGADALTLLRELQLGQAIIRTREKDLEMYHAKELRRIERHLNS